MICMNYKLSKIIKQKNLIFQKKELLLQLQKMVP
jgi:hypothetical protein